MAVTDEDAPLVEHGTRAAPLARIDWWFVAVGAVALLVYALHGFNGRLERDIALYIYSAQHVVDGVPPYISVLNRAGPLAHLLPAFGVAVARVFGFDDLLGARLVGLVFSVLAVCLSYVLGRTVFRSRAAGLATAAALLTFQGFIKYAAYGPREKTPMVVFVLLTLLCTARRQWYAAGASVAMAALIWQPAAVAGGVAVVAPIVALPAGQRLKALRAAVIGGAVPTLLTVAYFAGQGIWREFIDAFLLINLRYTVPSPAAGNARFIWWNLTYGYGVSLWVAIAGLVALLSLVSVRVVRQRGRALREPLVVAGAAGAIALAWSIYDFNGWPDLFYLLPFAALGIGALARLASARLSGPGYRLALTAWVAMALVMAVTYSVGERDTTLLAQRRSADKILSRLPDDATFMSMQAPQPLVLAGATSITRHQMFGRGLHTYVDDTWPGGLSGFAAWVERQRPDVIVWQTSFLTFPLGGLQDVVEQDYVRVAGGPAWVWFVHRAVYQEHFRRGG